MADYTTVLQDLENIRLIYQSKKSLLSNNTECLKQYEDNFIVNYTYGSTALEGNSLTLAETRILLMENKTPAGKDLREIYEQINHRDAFIYMVKEIKKGYDLNEDIICKIHRIVTQNIIPGGIYRTVPVFIAGASHDFPWPEDLPDQIHQFYTDLQQKNDICNLPEAASSFEVSCWTHAEFVRIHPFRDGNGRTGRLLMNYQLLKNNYLPVSIPVTDRMQYCTLLDDYCSTRDIRPFTMYISQLEINELNKMIDYEKQLSKIPLR